MVGVKIVGQVKWFDTKKGFGFIIGTDRRDVFVHYSAIEAGGYRVLREKEQVEYELIETPKGPAAAHVRPMLKDDEPPA